MEFVDQLNGSRVQNQSDTQGVDATEAPQEDAQVQELKAFLGLKLERHLEMLAAENFFLETMLSLSLEQLSVDLQRIAKQHEIEAKVRVPLGDLRKIEQAVAAKKAASNTGDDEDAQARRTTQRVLLTLAREIARSPWNVIELTSEEQIIDFLIDIALDSAAASDGMLAALHGIFMSRCLRPPPPSPSLQALI